MSRKHRNIGSMNTRIAAKDGRVIVEFAERTKWLAMTAVEAREMSLLLRQYADTLEPYTAANNVLPQVNRVPQNVGGLAFMEMTEMNVGSYTPLPDGKGPATEVHLSIKVKNLLHPLVMRFFGPKTLDQVIDALTRHRNDVWPQSKTIE